MKSEEQQASEAGFDLEELKDIQAMEKNIPNGWSLKLEDLYEIWK